MDFVDVEMMVLLLHCDVVAVVEEQQLDTMQCWVHFLVADVVFELTMGGHWMSESLLQLLYWRHWY